MLGWAIGMSSWTASIGSESSARASASSPSTQLASSATAWLEHPVGRQQVEQVLGRGQEELDAEVLAIGLAAWSIGMT